MHEFSGEAFLEHVQGRIDPKALLGTWMHKTDQAEEVLVLPDGCVDLLLSWSARDGVRLRYSALDARPSVKSIGPGVVMVGLRLSPGTHCKPLPYVDDARDAASAVSEAVCHSPALKEALACLAREPRPCVSARHLGVQMRTLQRLILRHTGKSPGFWAGLARARRAAEMLIQGEVPLGEVAHEVGFSDQSHMKRETRRWFGASPAEIRRFAGTPSHWLHQLSEPGYESLAIGEHTSTK